MFTTVSAHFLMETSQHFRSVQIALPVWKENTSASALSVVRNFSGISTITPHRCLRDNCLLFFWLVFLFSAPVCLLSPPLSSFCLQIPFSFLRFTGLTFYLQAFIKKPCMASKAPYKVYDIQGSKPCLYRHIVTSVKPWPAAPAAYWSGSGRPSPHPFPAGGWTCGPDHTAEQPSVRAFRQSRHSSGSAPQRWKH